MTAGGTLAALAAKQATKTMPIIFIAVSDPVSSGVVTRLAHPGGNVTGFSNVNAELVGKRLEYIMQAVPELSLVAVLWQSGGLGERTEAEMLKQADDAARALGVRLQLVEAREPADLEPAFSEVTRAKAHALTLFPSTMFFNERKRITDLAARNRLPAVYQLREFVEAEGLMAYGTNIADLFWRAAGYVDKILKGPSRAISPSSSQRSSNWSSTSRLRRRSAWRSPRRCWSAPTRSSSSPTGLCPSCA